MGYSCHLAIGISLKLKAKIPPTIIQRCHVHGPKDSKFCDECGKKVEQSNSMEDLLDEILEGEFSIIENDAASGWIAYSGRWNEVVQDHSEDKELFGMPERDEILDWCRNSDEYNRLANYFDIIEEIPCIGIYHNY